MGKQKYTKIQTLEREIVSMQAAGKRDQANSLDTPDVIQDAETVPAVLPSGNLRMVLPPESVCVLRVRPVEESGTCLVSI